MQRVKTLCFSLAVRCPLLCPLLCNVWARQTKHRLTQRNVLLTVGHCSLSWGRHTNGGLSKVTLLLFSGPILFTCLNTLNGALCVPMHERWGGGRGATIIKPSSLGGQTHNKAQKFPLLFSLLRPHRANMSGKLWLLLSAWLLLPFSDAGRQMPKLSDKKLCADSECSREYSLRSAGFFFPCKDCGA